MTNENTRATFGILALGAVSAGCYAILASAESPRGAPATYLACVAVAGAAAWGAFRVRARVPAVGPLIWVGALLFRAIVAVGAPGLSDDVYRYVWDGRVQVAGFHPYAHAPDDPALAELRDADWESINHRELKTIYPPAAEALFALLARLGLGVHGFKAVFGLADILVVGVLARLLRRLGLPPERIVLYAWNPLAVLETAGSGHVEPVGACLLLLAGWWVLEKREGLAAGALALAVHTKVLPLVAVPLHFVRLGGRRLLLPVFLVLPLLPYALGGPALGAGLGAYARRWEHNALVYPLLEAFLAWADTGPRLKPLVAWAAGMLPGAAFFWDELYHWVWPREIARALCAGAAAGWILWRCGRDRRDPLRAALPVLGAVLLLSPTLHPWYLLWVLPYAALLSSPFWLTFSATVHLAYLAPGGDVPWALRVVEYAVPVGVALLVRRRLLR